MRDSEQFFNEYIELAENIYHRVGASTSCDKDFTDDSIYPELSVASLIYNHFCDRYVVMLETPDQRLSMNKLVEHYDRNPEYAYAYLKQFEALLDKYHAENDYPIDYLHRAE